MKYIIVLNNEDGVFVVSSRAKSDSEGNLYADLSISTIDAHIFNHHTDLMVIATIFSSDKGYKLTKVEVGQ